MSKKIVIVIEFFLVAIITMILSCQKENTSAITPAITDTQVGDAQNISIVSNIYDDVDNQVQKALQGNLKSGSVEDSTITDNDDSSTIPKVVTWKKGLLEQVLLYNASKVNGKVLTGKINISISYPKIGDTTDQKKWLKTITFDNYSVDGRKIEGTKTLTFKGRVDGVHPEWDITLTNGKVTLKNGKTITFNYTRNRKMIEGYDTKTNLDNVFEINGSGNGFNSNTIAFTTADSNLVKVNGCPYYKSGTITHTSNKTSVNIDFDGGSSCNPNATIEVSGKIKSIKTDTESN
jgi:uncharacterized protein YxeA